MPKPRLSSMGLVLQLALEHGVEYRSIPEFQNYAVGSDGSVWSRKTVGPQINFGPWKRLRFSQDADRGRGNLPYLRVSLSNTKGHYYRVHILVLTVFRGPATHADMVARHDNGNCQDNRISNLFWGTPVENSADRLRHGTDTRGNKTNRTHLTEDDVRYIRSRSGIESDRALASQFAVTAHCIYCIRTRRRWWYVA